MRFLVENGSKISFSVKKGEKSIFFQRAVTQSVLARPLPLVLPFLLDISRRGDRRVVPVQDE